MSFFSLVFLALLLTGAAVRLWLNRRQHAAVCAHRGTVPAAFAAGLSLTDHQKAADYTVAKLRLSRWSVLADTLLLLLLTLGGGVDRIARWATAAAGDGLWGGVLLILAVFTLTGLVGLPFRIVRTFGIDGRFGFNRTTPGLFAADLLKGLVLGLLIGVPVLFAALWMMRDLGAAWWIWAWLAWSAFNLLLLAVYPTLIAPLFNKFSPLSDEPLRRRVEALLERTGFHAQGLFVMDGSRRSSHGNAYFTGFGRAKRIVFFDTLINRLAPAEVEAVLAHELGHYKLGHIPKRMIWLFASSLAGLALLGYLMQAAWFYEGLGISAANEATALVLFVLVSPVFTFFLQPLGAYYSRRHEFEADAYAARVSRAQDLISALVKLYKDNAATLTPDPLHSAFYDSHPPASVRIRHLEAQSG